MKYSSCENVAFQRPLLDNIFNGNWCIDLYYIPRITGVSRFRRRLRLGVSRFRLRLRLRLRLQPFEALQLDDDTLFQAIYTLSLLKLSFPFEASFTLDNLVWLLWLECSFDTTSQSVVINWNAKDEVWG